MNLGSEETRIRGRKRVAFRANKSERTITRWVSRGLLPVERDGPYPNSIIEVREADLAQLRRGERGGD